QVRAERALSEEDEADVGIRPRDRTGRPDEHTEPLLGAQAAGRAYARARRRGEQLDHPAAIGRVGLVEPLGPDRIAYDHHPGGRHAGAAHLDGLPLRDADDAIHPAAAEPDKARVALVTRG